jgi:stage II sporulation protein D
VKFPKPPLSWLRWSVLDWRVKFSLFVGGLFTVIVVIPSAIAFTLQSKTPATWNDWMHTQDATTVIKIYHMQTGKVYPTPLNDYLVDVLAGEMNPMAPMASLQAAAVAARTYAVYAMQHKDAAHPSFAKSRGADVTDSSVLDLPWLSMADQAHKYRGQQAVDTMRLQNAVLSTDGQVLTYHQQPILAFSFPLSPGSTRDGSKVFGRSLPYLASVPCPDDEKLARPYKQRFSAKVLGAALKLEAPVNPQKFKIAAAGGQGFVERVDYGAVQINGDDFVRLLGLPSAHFQLTASAAELTVTTEGKGSDLGLSLNEAKMLAEQGWTWQAILSKFYPGTNIVSDSAFTHFVP